MTHILYMSSLSFKQMLTKTFVSDAIVNEKMVMNVYLCFRDNYISVS